MAIGRSRASCPRAAPVREGGGRRPLPPWPFPPSVPASEPIAPRLVAALRRVVRLACLAAAGLGLWIALLDFPQRAFGLNFDESWAQALGHFLKHRFQAGADYLFTYGPLGFFLPPTYDPDLFRLKLAWELVVKLVFAATLLRLTRGYSSLPARLACCWVPAIFAGQILAVSADALYLAIILAHVLLILDPLQKRPTTFQATSLLILAGLSLIKFSFLLFTLVALALVTASRLGLRPRPRVLGPAVGFVGFFILFWLALGQHMGNLPGYFKGSLEITSGYFEALAVKGAGVEVYLALTICLLLAACLALPACRGGRPLTAALIVGLGVFSLWKQGFVRHDHHSVGFFAFTLVLPFLVPAAFPGCRWRGPVRLALLTAAVLLSGLGLELALRNNGMEYAFDPLRLTGRAFERGRQNLRTLLAPSRLRRRLEEQRAALAAENALPRIKAALHGAPVDMISYELGTVFLNELTWHPRPVFQSYSAFTPALLAANARFIEQAQAPEYVIFKLQTLDDRPPTLDDGALLLKLFRTYRPILAEKTYLLFQRRPDRAGPVSCAPAVRRTRVIRFNEEVPLDDRGSTPEKITLQVRYSAWGKLLNGLYKPSPLFLQVRTATGQDVTYRLIPGMARTGFLINPLLRDTADVILLYGAAPRDRVVAVCLQADADAQRCYRGEIPMTLESLPDLAKLAPWAP
jgi:hypothetical protein